MTNAIDIFRQAIQRDTAISDRARRIAAGLDAGWLTLEPIWAPDPVSPNKPRLVGCSVVVAPEYRDVYRAIRAAHRRGLPGRQPRRKRVWSMPRRNLIDNPSFERIDPANTDSPWKMQ